MRDPARKPSPYQTKRVLVTMTVAVEPTVTSIELREFIDSAVSSWGGQRHPEDHLFDGAPPVRLTTKVLT